MAQFKARARTVDMLGRQQIAGIPTAISELFKNAHEAYADNVVVDFLRPSGMLVLRDDGIGTTKHAFEERWLTLGTESQLEKKIGIPRPPIDPNKPRRPGLGEKGIGKSQSSRASNFKTCARCSTLEESARHSHQDSQTFVISEALFCIRGYLPLCTVITV